jgi:NAD(P)-dependent dehydrogenase (short-subunit alcohol dehydrogenase family)
MTVTTLPDQSATSDEFAGRVAWIVGASGALGAAVARALAAHGARVALSGRDTDKLAALAAEIGPAAQTFPLDIGSDALVRAAADVLIAEYGRIDFLVNSTSVSVFGDFLTLTDEDWLKVFNAKHLGYVRTLRAALPHMIAQKFGRVVNVSGRGGQHPSRIHLPGGSANAAVDLLTKGLSKIYAEHGIRINAVSPGPIRSPRLAAMQGAGRPKTGPVLGDGFPEDIAEATLFLLSEKSRFITGESLQVDGGGPGLA